MKVDIRRWIESGADLRTGVRFLTLLSPNPGLARLVELNPRRYMPLLIQKLKEVSGLTEMPRSVCPEKPPRPLREEWPFLAEKDCPNELKIRAADKITCYRSYVEAHEKLFSCTSAEECYETAKNLIKSFTQNRKILSEFTYYREHHRILGRHPIFGELKKAAALRRLSIPELCRKRDNLKEAIWRLRHEIARGDKPHLQENRETRISQKERELDEVERILAAYA